MSRDDHWPDNLPGRFAVNRDCVCCSVCSAIAPELFAMSEQEDHLRVARQPASTEEVALATEARQCCPADAIEDLSPG